MKPLKEKKRKIAVSSKHRAAFGKALMFIPCAVLILASLMYGDSSLSIKRDICDINGDGIISRTDASYILSYCASLTSDFSEDFASRADTNGDGKVTSLDAYTVLKNISSSVVVMSEETTQELTTAPLVENTFSASSENGEPVDAPVSGQSLYDVISNDKMYIYPDMSQVMQMRNTFVIITFGWGHGVGMSQWGAVGLARAGYSYIQIIQHYYNGVAIMKEQIPATVRCAGRNVDTVEMLARIIQQEISGITTKNDPLDMNALRAQAVAAYTNMKYSDYSVSGCSYVSSYDNCREDVKRIAREIAGQFIEYNGNVVYAFYSACSAGVSARYEQIWGQTSRDMSYLANSASYSDCYTAGYITAEAYSVESIRNYIKSYDSSINLSLNPADWIEIIDHDDAVNKDIGYVSSMRIGDRIISQGAGMVFRDKIMKYDIKSPCFAIIYNGKYL